MIMFQHGKISDSEEAFKAKQRKFLLQVNVIQNLLSILYRRAADNIYIYIYIPIGMYAVNLILYQRSCVYLQST